MIYPPEPSTAIGIYIKLQIIYNLMLIIDCYQDVKRFSTSITKKILENKLSYPNPKGGHVMRFQVFLSLWSVTRRQVHR